MESDLVRVIATPVLYKTQRTPDFSFNGMRLWVSKKVFLQSSLLIHVSDQRHFLLPEGYLYLPLYTVLKYHTVEKHLPSQCSIFSNWETFNKLIHFGLILWSHNQNMYSMSEYACKCTSLSIIMKWLVSELSGKITQSKNNSMGTFSYSLSYNPIESLGEGKGLHSEY